MNFFDEYNEIVNYFFEHILKDELIHSFVEIYGKKYELKIKNVINNLMVIRVQPNLGKNKFQNKIDFYLEKLKEEAKLIFNELDISYEENTIFREIEKLLELDNPVLKDMIHEKNLDKEYDNLKLFWYKYHYYKEFQGIDSKKKLFITGKNVTDSKYDYLIDEIDDVVADGAVFMHINSCFLIVSYGYGIDFSVFIHEINHLLSKELLLDLGNDEFLSQYGFLKLGDWFYEIINDYISLDVLKILNCRVNHEFDFILKRDNYYSGYLDVDRVCRYPIRSVYGMARELILESLINGNGDKFVKVIGKRNYSKVVVLLNECNSLIMSQLLANPHLKIEEAFLDEEKYDLFDEYLSDIYNRLFEYFDYNENLEKELNRLEKNGTIRRL